MAEATTTKTRTRAQATEFGRAFKSLVNSVDQRRLAARVAERLNDKDVEKVASKIANLVRKASNENGVISIRSKETAEFIFAEVVQMSPVMQAVADKLKQEITYSPISSSNRDSGTNWIVRLKAGEAVATDGHEGHGLYKLVKVGEATEAAGDDE